MKQIYNFEKDIPPVLNENILRAKAENKKETKLMVLLVLAAVVCQIAVLLFGVSAIEWHPWITFSCVGYALISTLSGGILAAGCTKKEVI